MSWDRVLTVNDFYDAPRFGVAEVGGIPHVYKAEFDEDADEYADTYLVCPIEPELLALILEDWEIWLRFQRAWQRGEVSLDSHPALPEDRARHQVIERNIGDRFCVSQSSARRLRAKFGKDPASDDGFWIGMKVCWSEVEFGPLCPTDSAGAAGT